MTHASPPDEPPATPESAADTLTMLRAMAARGLLRQGTLARGGMATIDAVIDPVLERRMAMKVISPALSDDAAAVAYFVREAHITGQLDHPNIVPVHQLGVNDAGQPWFTMKLVEGETLEARVVRRLRRPAEPLDPGELFDLVGVLIKVCEALEMAHARGVIHCDLKPLNVMVGDYGQVYLMDWGIARLVTPASITDDPGNTVENPVSTYVPDLPIDGVMGTPAYMAPEQAEAGALDERTDVFALGGLLYFVLTGLAPFEHPDPMEAMRRAHRVRCTPVEELAPETPRGLVRIVERAMSRDPTARYPDIGTLRAALQRHLRGEGAFPEVTVARGEHVVVEGDAADAAYVIVRGRCQVYTRREGRHSRVGELGPGDVFGETAILAESTRTASVVADCDTVLLRVTAEHWEQALTDMRPWLRAFVRALATRFKEQLDRTAGGAQPRPSERLNLALMYLTTWGVDDADGSVTLPWAAFAARMQRDHAVPERALAIGLSSIEGLEIDAARDRVTLCEPRRALDRLRRRLVDDLCVDDL